MENITIKNSLVYWRKNKDLVIEQIDRLGDEAIHLTTSIGTTFFDVNDTTINGVKYDNIDEFIAALK